MGEYWEKLITYDIWDIPIGKIGAFLGIFLLLFLIRFAIIKWVLNWIEKGTKKTKNTIDDQILEIVTPPIKFILLIIIFSISLTVLKLPEKSILWINTIIRSAVIISIFWALYRSTDIVSDMLKSWTNRTQSELDDKIVAFVVKILNILIIIIAIVILIQEWNYDVTGIITGLGIGGLAFALAAKDTLANIFGLMMIIADKPFSIGDWIKTPQVEGTIEDIGFRSVKVRRFDQALVSVPNSVIANEAITNWSRMGKRRIKFNMGVTYSATPDQIRAFTRRAERFLQNHPDIHTEFIMVRFTHFNDSSQDIFFYFFTTTTLWHEFLAVQESVKLDIAKIATEMGLSFAFPSTSVYMENPNDREIDHYDKKAKKFLSSYTETEREITEEQKISNEDAG